MPYDRFYIGSPKTGLQTDIKPFAIPDDAFSVLQNAYVFRERTRKRPGAEFLNGATDQFDQQKSRLRVKLTGVTPGPLNLPPGANQLAIGQMFSVGTDIFTVFQLGAGVTTLSTNPAITTTINSTVNPNTVTFTGSAGGTAYWYPSLPVMGFPTYQLAKVNNELLFAFDTRFAYQRSSGVGWERLATENQVGAATWTGSDSQFFWSANYRGVNQSQRYLFVTNYNASEPNFMRFWDGSAWNNFNPAFSSVAGNTVLTARIVIPFRDRLLLLNTVENNSILGNGLIFGNRCRFSVIGDPTSATAFFETPNPAGFGGFIDNLATNEVIVSAEFIKDRLIVFFERSTWELVYTGNDILPFRWQQLNVELGVESTFSVVPFDKVLLGIGDVGVHACNGANVERIDNKIPDEIFDIMNGDTVIGRVYGIRDYFTECVYWTFPLVGDNQIYPNQMLLYNYKNGSWALFDDSITAFGYFQNEDDRTWANTNEPWFELEEPWLTGQEQKLFREVVGGNQEGYTFKFVQDLPRNSGSLQITTFIGATITAINHNLRNGDYVLLENAQGASTVTSLNNGIYQVQFVDNNTIKILSDPSVTISVGTTDYIGGGTLARVSIIDIVTKQYNFYNEKGRNVYIPKVDFFVDKTANGQVTVDCFPSTTDDVSLIANANGSIFSPVVGTSILEMTPFADFTLEQFQAQLWHPVYFNAEGETVQFNITLTDSLEVPASQSQIRNANISLSDFQLNAMIIYAMPTTSRPQ